MCRGSRNSVYIRTGLSFEMPTFNWNCIEPVKDKNWEKSRGESCIRENDNHCKCLSLKVYRKVPNACDQPQVKGEVAGGRTLVMASGQRNNTILGQSFASDYYFTEITAF